MFEKNLHERAEMVRAMDRVAWCLNNEDTLMLWLSSGVADGDVTGREPDEDLEWYCEDKNFAHLMFWFLRLMKRAAEDEDGGLFCNGVVSRNKYEQKGDEEILNLNLSVKYTEADDSYQVTFKTSDDASRIIAKGLDELEVCAGQELRAWIEEVKAN